MEKLTLKELAPYLPYSLMVLNLHTNLTYQLTGRVIDRVANLNESHKPILRNISDLTKEIEHNGEKFVPSNKFQNLYLNDVRWGDNSIGTGILRKNGYMIDICFINNEILGECPLAIYELLIEWHFDVFGLRERGLCIYYNEL